MSKSLTEKFIEDFTEYKQLSEDGNGTLESMQDNFRKSYSFELDICKTRPNKVYFERQNEESIYLQGRLTSERCTSMKFLTSKLMSALDVRYGGLVDSLKDRVVVLIDRTLGLCYSEKFGILPLNEIPKNAFTIEYDAENEEDLKAEFVRRKTAFQAIGERFNLNPEDYFYSDVLFARAIASQHLKIFHNTQHVTEKEYHYIDGATRGGLMYADVGEKYERGCKLDINSMYGFCMASPDFQFPLRVGQFCKLQNVSKTELAIYALDIRSVPKEKCEFWRPKPEKPKKKYEFWKPNPNNLYTTYDIEIMDLLGIEYRIADCDINALVFPKGTTLQGSESFAYMNDMYALRSSASKYVKRVMNCTWGALCREKDVEIPIGDVTEKMTSRIVKVDLDKGYATMKMDDHPYKFATARLKPFLTSFARLYMIKNVLKPLLKRGAKIVQVNTDGCIVTKIEKETIMKIIPISSKFGEVKFEKEEAFNGPFEIRHVNKIIFLDTV